MSRRMFLPPKCQLTCHARSCTSDVTVVDLVLCEMARIIHQKVYCSVMSVRFLKKWQRFLWKRYSGFMCGFGV